MTHRVPPPPPGVPAEMTITLDCFGWEHNMRLITTFEEVEALPLNAVLRDSGGTVFERWHNAENPAADGDWYGLGMIDECWDSSLIKLPAYVLWPEDHKPTVSDGSTT